MAGTDATVVDFWRFTLSNLRMNNARGYLDEFLATRAIGLAGLPVKWHSYNALTLNGATIGVEEGYSGEGVGVWVGVLCRGDGSFLWENSCRQTKPLWKRAIAVKCTTGLSAHQFAELTQWISQSKPLHTIPAILGVAGSLQATLVYLRHNLPQAAIGELLGVSQPTVSRAVKALTELVTRALDGYLILITAEEVAPGCDYVLDGTLMPCWSWKAHPELWSGKHKRTGLNVQVLVTPAGRLVWVSDPCPGSTHDIAALDASGLLEGLDVSGWVADKGYIGRGMITPPRKPAGKQLSDTAKKVSRSINRVRYIVEQVNAHIKAWKILKEDYRRPLDTFPQTITATLMLYTYTTTP